MNPFDQFDAPATAAANPFDQFDPAAAAAPTVTPAGMGGAAVPAPAWATPTPQAQPGMGGAVAPTGPMAPVPPLTEEGVRRDYLQEDPNVGSYLPIRTDPATGAPTGVALPNAVRALGRGALDLIHGPETGTVTPDALGALATVAMGGGLGSSVAKDTGAAIAGRLYGSGRNEPTILDALKAAIEKSDVPKNALSPPEVTPPPAAPVGAPVADPAPAPAPQSAGAAASPPGAADLTPQQVLAYRSTAEGQKLLEPQPAGQQDLNQYVTGSNPTTAQIEQTVAAAREQKVLGMKSPEVSQEAINIAADNNDARSLHFNAMAGSDVDVANAVAARSAQADKDLAATFANKGEADPTPVFSAAADILASPDGKRPIVRSAVQAAIDGLSKSDGTVETDPEQLYGVRKNIDDMLSKEAGIADPKSTRAAAALQTLKGSLDGVIEQAAPGFGQYLKNFSEASRPIDVMNVLQKHEPKLYGSNNVMQYSKVQTMMKQIVDSRASPGLNPYKSITDDTMGRLWNLRDDLRRSATAGDLARAPGSDTAQNLWDMAKGAAPTLAVHGIANAISPGIGSVVVGLTKNALSPALDARRARADTARGLQMLRPNALLRDPSQP